MSFVARHPMVPPALSQRPSAPQNLEQHTSLLAHVLPSVVQTDPGRGAHVVPWQFAEQQSELPPHVWPSTVHVADAHWLLLQFKLQQSVGDTHVAPAAAHIPPAAVHWCDRRSQCPEQHPAFPPHVAPFGSHGPSASGIGASMAPPPPASMFDVVMELLPHAHIHTAKARQRRMPPRYSNLR